MADFVFVRQARQNGLGDAVRTARVAVHDEPFVLFLPDDIVLGDPSPTQELLRAYEKYHASVIAVESVPRRKLAATASWRVRLLTSARRS